MKIIYNKAFVKRGFPGIIFGMLFLACLLAVSALATARANPPIPIWPDQFNSQFKVFVKDYGPDWSSTGAIYYNWVTKV